MKARQLKDLKLAYLQHKNPHSGYKNRRGRPPRQDITIFGAGRVRLPQAGFHGVKEVIVEYAHPRTVRFRPAKPGEIGILLQFGRRSYSPQLNINKVLLRLGIDKRKCAGSYIPTIEGDCYSIDLEVQPESPVV